VANKIKRLVRKHAAEDLFLLQVSSCDSIH